LRGRPKALEEVPTRAAARERGVCVGNVIRDAKPPLPLLAIGGTPRAAAASLGGSRRGGAQALDR